VGDFDTSVGHIHVDLIPSCCYHHGYMTTNMVEERVAE
jgi:hypothetical protein